MSIINLPYEIRKEIYHSLLRDETNEKEAVNLISSLSLIDRISYTIVNDFFGICYGKIRYYIPQSITPYKEITLIKMKELMINAEAEEESLHGTEDENSKSPQNFRFLLIALSALFFKTYGIAPKLFPFLQGEDQNVIGKFLDQIQSKKDQVVIDLWLEINNKLQPEYQRNDLNSADEIRDYINYLKGKNLFPLITKLPKDCLKSSPIGIEEFLPCLKSICIKNAEIDFFPSFGNLQSLQLQFCKIIEIPRSIFYLTQLTDLNLSYNEISHISNLISNMTLLKVVNLLDNELTNIPSSVLKLTNLEKLYIVNNNLNKISNQISKLTRLEVLNLNNNKIKYIPDSISCLINLKVIFLKYNNIEYITKSLFYLPKLHSIYLNNNKISFLSGEFLNPARTDKLELCLENNFITGIPEQILINKTLELNLNKNPLLFIHPGLIVNFSSEKFLKKHEDFKNYHCLSEFSKLCQLMIFSDDFEEIKAAYFNLKQKDRDLISNTVISLFKKEGVNFSIKEKIDVFNNRHIFYRAVYQVIYNKSGGILPKKLKEACHALQKKMGSLGTKNHVLLLLDAIASIENEGLKEKLARKIRNIRHKI